VAQIRHQEAGNPYEAVIVRGWVTDMTHDGADEHIDWLAKKYPRPGVSARRARGTRPAWGTDAPRGC
jgi:hypothetical protein